MDADPATLITHALLPWLSLGWLLYLVALTVWIILQKRSPLSTWAWILSLAALPLIGFVIYFFLGPTRIRRQRLKRERLRARQQIRASGDAALAAGLPQRKRGLSDLVDKATGAPVSSLVEAELLVGGETTYEALFAAIRAAKRHVHLEYYIFEPDRIGRALRDLLVAAQQRGVAVRMLVDAVGSTRAGRRFWAPLRAAGGEVARFHPFRLATLKPLLNLRTHRKIAVIDGEVGFCGGINVSEDHDARFAARPWHDLHVRMRGPAVGWLQAVFAEDWLYARKRPLPEQELYPDCDAGPIAAQVIASGPDSDSEAIHRAFLQAMADARERVWVATPYFAPGDAALYTLTNAAMRGVDVRVLLPQRSDSRVVSAAARSFYDELLARGIKVFEYTAGMLHSKLMVVDQDCTILGTANFDLRSFRLNFEVALAVYDPAFCARCAAQFEADLELSTRITLPRPIGWMDRFGEACARLLTPVL